MAGCAARFQPGRFVSPPVQPAGGMGRSAHRLVIWWRPAKMLGIPALAVECIVIFTQRFAGRGCTLEMSDEGVGQQLCVQFKSILTQGFNAEPRLVDPDETAPVALGKLGIIP